MFAKLSWTVLLVVVGIHSVAAAQDAPPSNADLQDKPALTTWHFDAEFCDHGNLRLALDHDRLEFETPFGKLQIPVSEIRQIEVAVRLTEAEQKRLDAAIFNLGSADFGQRTEATTALLELGAKAYPAVVKAARHADLEVAHRAQEMAEKMRGALSEAELAPREYDLLETEYSRIAGKIVASQLSVRTTQFGKQQLQLSDVRTLVATSAPRTAVEPVDVQPDPGNLLSLHGSIGKTLAFKVTGRGDGSVYGTGVYTTDSNLATAAVHCGVLKVGETGIVRVAIIPSPPAFASTSQNGITSSPWGPYPAAYQVVVPKRK